MGEDPSALRVAMNRPGGEIPLSRPRTGGRIDNVNQSCVVRGLTR